MADDYAGSTSTTGTLSVGGSRSASIETAGDTDWFRITLQAGYTYQFDMLGSPTGDGTLTDPFMRIRDSAGNSLASDDDAGTGYNARISSFTATYGGTYYVSAGSSTSSGTGSYRVTATQTGTPAPEVTVLGSGVGILDGDSTPSTADQTDFGTVAVGATAVSTFTVRNDGAATLSLGSLSVPVGFTVTDALVASLAPGASDTIAVKMATASTGTRSGQISFTTNDPDEGVFNFSITGTVTSTPPPPPSSSTWSKPIALHHLPVVGSTRVTQGFGGDTSHSNGSNTSDYAWIDFAAEVQSSTVRAVGSGTVVGRREGSYNGDDKGGGNFGNYVTVRQHDGLLVLYARLSSVLVNMNQSVVAGRTDLGLTGNTGVSQAEHLHLSFGTTTLGYVDDGDLQRPKVATGSLAFFASHFASSLETDRLFNPFDPQTILSTDIFGSSQATQRNGTPYGNSDQDELVGSAANNRIFGASGNDRLYGAGGQDTLVGGRGDDVLYGGDDNDVLIGGRGADALFGGTGTDHADYRRSAGVQVSLDGSLAGTGDAVGDNLTSIEGVRGSLSGADRIRGDGGVNILFGYGGNDTLEGGGGNDRIRGGTGADTLSGGAGTDWFQYGSRAEGGDIILDWDVGGTADRIHIYGPAFNGLPGGALAAHHFRSGTTNSALDADDFFLFRTTDRTVWFDPDGSGAQAPILFADLQDGAAVSAGDIWVWT